MHPFRRGMKVICINKGPLPFHSNQTERLSIGQVYTIRDISNCKPVCGVELEEIFAQVFGVSRFRPFDTAGYFIEVSNPILLDSH